MIRNLITINYHSAKCYKDFFISLTETSYINQNDSPQKQRIH